MLAKNAKEIVIYKHKLEMEMQNLKIDLIDILHNEDKKQEAVWMLNKIGYKTGYKSVDFYRYLYACGSGDDQYSKTIQFGNNAKTFRNSDFKEITITELRAMVKPKMKEYLMPNINYEYILTDAREALEPHAKDWISIPVGAEILSTDGDGNGLIFWKDDFNLVVGLDDHWDKVHQNFNSFYSAYPRCEVLWQRPTQPEALPFIDDNPQSLNEQYAEIEQVRQNKKHERNSSAWDVQVGGDHYKQFKIQPMQFALENKLDAAQQNVIKYIMRHSFKNGKQDLEKAKHYIDLMIEFYYGGNNNG